MFSDELEKISWEETTARDQRQDGGRRAPRPLERTL